jgi:hypothetical protein
MFFIGRQHLHGHTRGKSKAKKSWTGPSVRICELSERGHSCPPAISEG